MLHIQDLLNYCMYHRIILKIANENIMSSKLSESDESVVFLFFSARRKTFMMTYKNQSKSHKFGININCHNKLTQF